MKLCTNEDCRHGWGETTDTGRVPCESCYTILQEIYTQLEKEVKKAYPPGRTRHDSQLPYSKRISQCVFRRVLGDEAITFILKGE